MGSSVAVYILLLASSIGIDNLVDMIAVHVAKENNFEKGRKQSWLKSGAVNQSFTKHVQDKL